MTTLALVACGSLAEAREPRQNPDHASLMRIENFSGEIAEERITVGVDKSVLIEVPITLTDVLVSNPEVVDASVQSSRVVYLIAKDLGEANVIMVGDDGRKLVVEVAVTRDLAPLAATIARLIPGSNIRAEMVGDHVVLSGEALTPLDANRAGDLAARYLKSKDRVVNLVKSAANEQVHLRVKVAEMSRDAIRRLGVDFNEVLLKAGQFTFGAVTRNVFPATGQIVPGGIVAGGAPLVAAGSGRTFGWSNGGDQSIQALLQSLERTGLIRTLAEPNLTAVSGETAKFLAGGEFPIPIAQNERQVSIEFKEFGVTLEFKPVVLDAGNISLRISAAVSELSTEGAVQLTGFAVPGLKVRRAETTIELPSGGTLAMAGLISAETIQSVEGIPGLKDIPTLGALFRSNDFRKRETELVVLVTPYLAAHAHESAFRAPTDGFAPESELNRLVYGRLNRIYGGRLSIKDAERGTYGFIVEYPDSDERG
ncbi:MAG: type II and III secretion system protein family protein [Hyphomicrobiaceae bacterium]